jgi:hypothetical protein
MGADVAVHDRLAVVSAEEMYVSKFTNFFGYVKITAASSDPGSLVRGRCPNQPHVPARGANLGEL